MDQNPDCRVILGIDVVNRQVRAKTVSGQLLFPTLENNYPRWQKVIPDSKDWISFARIDVRVFLDVIKKYIKQLGKSENSAVFYINKNGISLAREAGFKAEIRFKPESIIGKGRVALNVIFVKQMLKAINSDVVDMYVNKEE